MVFAAHSHTHRSLQAPGSRYSRSSFEVQLPTSHNPHEPTHAHAHHQDRRRTADSSKNIICWRGDLRPKSPLFPSATLHCSSLSLFVSLPVVSNPGKYLRNQLGCKINWMTIQEPLNFLLPTGGCAHSPALWTSTGPAQRSVSVWLLVVGLPSN